MGDLRGGKESAALGETVENDVGGAIQQFRRERGGIRAAFVQVEGHDGAAAGGVNDDAAEGGLDGGAGLDEGTVEGGVAGEHSEDHGAVGIITNGITRKADGDTPQGEEDGDIAAIAADHVFISGDDGIPFVIQWLGDGDEVVDTNLAIDNDCGGRHAYRSPAALS